MTEESKMAGVMRFDHVGLCVRDLDRSVEFYREVLGFTVLGGFSNPKLGQLLEIDAQVVRGVMIERDGHVLELMSFEHGATGSEERGPWNQLGLTHIQMYVDDLDAMISRVEAAGGIVHHHTRYAGRGGPGLTTDTVIVSDPDGVTRIELAQLTGSDRALLTDKPLFST